MPTHTTSHSANPAARVAAVLDAARTPVAILPDLDRCDAAAVVFADYLAASGVTFRLDEAHRMAGGCEGFYRPSQDLIVLPPFDAAGDVPSYHWTAFHEAAHSTGHATRLARDFSGGIGSKAYAREELTAVVTAGIVCAALGLRDETAEVHDTQLEIQLRQLTEFDVTDTIDAAWPAARMVLGAHAPAWAGDVAQLHA